MIQANGLTKRYGNKVAVDNVTFTVKPGMVTGFLGPNGAGKSTTMRLIVGLDKPTSGSVSVNGQSYINLRSPLHEVGVLLDAKAVHTGRSALSHLLALGATHGIGRSRVDEVISMTGLDSVARKRVGGFSLGMGQRLGLAAALLGNPATLILDEPINGLDPEGVIWVRTLARHLASEGRTVFLSSHLMSEMSQTADHIIVLGRGRIIADSPVADMLALATGTGVRVSTPDGATLVPLLSSPGVTVVSTAPDVFTITGLAAPQIAQIAAGAGIVLNELSSITASLEDAYLELTKNEVEYHASAMPVAPSAPMTNESSKK